MNKKILFVSMLAVLLMVSMPFVSTLQAAYVQPVSTSVTKTTTTATDLTLNQQEIISVLRIAKLRATTPSDQALYQQAIQYVYMNGMNWDCVIALVIFMAIAGLALGNLGFGVTNLYDWLVDGEGFVDIETLLEQLYNAGVLGYSAWVIWNGAVMYICFPNVGTAQQSSQSVPLQATSSSQTACSLCAAK